MTAESFQSRCRPVVIVMSALLTLAATDLVVRRAGPHLALYDNNGYMRKTVAFATGAGADILLLGSSRTRYGLVPEVFAQMTGERAFNMGVSNSKVVEWRKTADDALSHHRPRLVVLGVNASEFRGNYSPVDAARVFFNLSDARRYIRAYGWDSEVVGAYLQARASDVWETYGKKFTLRLAAADAVPNKWGISSLAPDLRQMTLRGVPADGNDHPWQPGDIGKLSCRIRNSHDNDWAPDPPPFDAHGAAFVEFDAMLQWLHHERLPVLVVYIPNCPSLEELWSCVEPAMRDRLAEICRDQRVPFVRLDPRTLPRSDDDYLDDAHVGLPLALRLSRCVVEQLFELGFCEKPNAGLASTKPPSILDHVP